MARLFRGAGHHITPSLFCVPFADIARISSLLHHPLLNLTPPVQLFHEVSRIAPARLSLHIKLKKYLGSHHALNLNPRRGSNLLQHSSAFAHQNPLLPVALAIDRSGDPRETLAFLEAVHKDSRRIWNFFAGIY